MKIKSLLRIINLPFKAFYKLLFPWKNLSKRNQKIVTITSIIVILVMIPVIFYTLSHLRGASAAWFNDNWGFRQIVAITNAGTAQTDFQVSITLDTATLITAGKIRSDCNDIRITDINGRLIPYWIEESPTTNACNSSTTKIWTKVPSIPTSGASIYLYYGNPSATSVKNGYKTFEQFDDFNRADNTNVGNNWLETDGAGSAEISSNQLKLSITNTTKNGVIAYKPYTTSSAVAMEYSTKNTTLYRAAQGFFVSLSSWTNIYTQEYATLAPYSTVWINKNYYVTGARQEATITSATTDTTNFYRGKVEILGTTDNYSWSLPGTNNFTDTQASVDNYSAVQNFGFTVWNDGSASNLPVSYIDWFSIRKTATTPPSVASPANEEVGAAPIAYWKFDEGTGTTVNDSSSNKFNGTLGGSSLPSWKPESECISGKCLFFDSSNTANNPKVTLNESSTTKTNILTDVTISLWFKPATGYNTTSQAIMRNGQGADLVYSVFYDPTNQRPYFHWYDGTFKQVNGTTNSAPLNKWTHVEIVRSGTSLNFYVNGNLTNSETVTAPTVSASQLAIGQTNNDAVGQDYHGFIDDIKIYSYARTAAQIKTDYSSRGSVKGVSAQIGGSDINKNLSNGLVGFWKQDEATWSGTLNEVLDSSGNGNHGQAQGAAGGKAFATPSAKFGNGGYFDGVDDYVDIPYTASIHPGDTFTLTAWVKRTGTGTADAIIAGGTSDYQFWFFSDNKLYLSKEGVSNVFTSTSTYTDSNWHHYVATKNGSDIHVYRDGVEISGTTSNATIVASGSSSAFIGGDGNSGNVFVGQIDEARVYNRALSSSEVSQLYNYRPSPLGYWGFEDGSGGSVKDSSGTQNGTWSGTGTTHWAQGKYGKAGQFDGSTDSVDISNSIYKFGPNNSFTISTWFKDTGSTDANPGIFFQQANCNKFNYGFYVSGGSLSFLGGKTCVGSNSAIGGAVNRNQWYYVTGIFDATTNQFKIYVNGVLAGTTAYTFGQLSAADTTATIGADGPFAGRFFKGNVDELRIYNYTLDAKQIVSDMNGGHPNVGSPVGSAVGYWKMDEGYGTTANNSGNGGANLKGTLNGMASPPTATSGWQQAGKFGKALAFNKGSTYVNMGNPTALQITSDLTISAWIYPSQFSSNGGIASKYYNTNGNRGYNFGVNSAGQLAFRASVDGTATVDTGSTHTVSLNSWTYVSVAYNAAAGTASYYINGKLDNTATGLPNSLYNPGGINFQVGAWDAGATGANLFAGLIDEVKIYNYVLTASDIKLDYNHGASQVLGSMSDTSGLTGGSVASNSASVAYCIPGDTSTCSAPVGDWNFEEKNGVTANDISGNGNTGTLISSPRWTSGKYGAALEFNGTNQTVSTGTLSTLDSKSGMTIEAWVKPTNITTNTYYEIMRQNNGPNWLLSFQDNGTILSFGLNAGGSYGELDVSITAGDYTDGNWHHITAVYDGSNKYLYKDGRQIGSQVKTGVISGNGATNYIGSLAGGGEWFKGKIDNVKVYDYGRTPAQVAYDYNRGAPVGYWKMDECQGGNAYDSSGNGKTGTITIGGTGSQTVLGTCSTPTDGTGAWYNGRTGKYNSSLNFDGTNDYVSVGQMDIPSDITVAAWVYSSNYNQNGFIVGKNTVNTQWELFFEGTSLRWRGGAAENTVSCSLPTNNQWHYIVGKQSGTTGELYIDGVSCDTGTVTAIGNGSGDVEIGRFNGGYYFSGQIDDARIYNYVLTTAQIKQVYNQGSGVRFGPQTGTP